MPLLRDNIGDICVIKYINSYQESSLDSPLSQHITTASFKHIEEKKNSDVFLQNLSLCSSISGDQKLNELKLLSAFSLISMHYLYEGSKSED